MRATKRRRPMRRSRCAAPAEVDLAVLAGRTTYVGSPEHKAYPSFAGQPRPRADASKCDPALGDRALLTSWLRAAISAGDIGAPWEGEFPRYVWCRRGEVVYEGRLVNQELGQYKGWPLVRSEWPEGIL